MSNPYATPASDVEVDEAAPFVSKPRRVWVFQALLLFQLVAGVVLTVMAVLVPEVRGLPLSTILLGLLRPILGIPIVVALLLTLQRVGPKPSVAAPALASLWWLFSVSAHFAIVAPASQASASGPSTTPWVHGVILHVLLLWFVVSTWLHGRTRAYLAQATSS